MAKLRPDQLSAALRRQLAPIYLISGDEPLLVQEACDLVRSQARANGFSEREVYHADNNFDWQQLLSAANNLSLFAEQKLIDLRLDTGKVNDKGSKALQEFCQSPPADTVLLITAPKLDGSTQRSKWVKALEQHGDTVQVWPVQGEQLTRWIDQRLQQAGLKADSAALELIASRVEGNLLAAVQEIEKLKLLAPDGMITAHTVAGAVADSARYDVFALVDKALHGDARGAVKTLQGLKGEGTEPTVILWALTREIRLLAQIAQAMQQGDNFDRAAGQYRVWDKRKPLLNNALRRLKHTQLTLLVRKANGIDKSIKGMRNSDTWDELLDLTLNLSGIFSLSPAVQKLSLSL